MFDMCFVLYLTYSWPAENMYFSSITISIIIFGNKWYFCLAPPSSVHHHLLLILLVIHQARHFSACLAGTSSRYHSPRARLASLHLELGQEPNPCPSSMHPPATGTPTSTAPRSSCPCSSFVHLFTSPLSELLLQSTANKQLPLGIVRLAMLKFLNLPVHCLFA